MIRSGMFNLIGQVARVMASVVTIPLLIHFLEIEQYGLWVLISAIVGFAMIAEAGLTTSSTFFIAKDLASKNINDLSASITIISIMMFVLASAVALSVYLSASTIVQWYPNLTPVKQVMVASALQVGAIATWAQLLQQVLSGLLQAYQRYDLVNILRILQSVAANLLLILVAWRGGNVIHLTTVLAMMSLFLLLLNMIFVWRLIRHKGLVPQWDWIKGREIFRYGIVTWVGTIGTTLFGQGDRLIVGRLLGSEILGVYGAITSLTIQINSFSGLIIQPILPLTSTLYAAQTGEALDSLRSYVRRSTVLNIFVALAIGLALISSAPVILRFVLGGIPAPSDIQALQLGSVIYTLYSLNAVGYFVLLGMNRLMINALVPLISGIFVLLLIIIFARHWGLKGAILGNVGYILTLVLPMYTARQLGLRWNTTFLIGWFPITLFLLGSGIMIFVLLDIYVMIILSLVIYILLGYWFLNSYGVHLATLLRTLKSART